MTLNALPLAETLKLSPAGIQTITLDVAASTNPDLSGRDVRFWLQPRALGAPDINESLVAITRDDSDAATGVVRWSFDKAALWAAVGGSTVRGLVVGDGPDGDPWFSLLVVLDLDGTQAQSAVTLPAIAGGSLELTATLSSIAGGKGDPGDDGADGRTVLSGTGAPSDVADGADGDFYIDPDGPTLYGPKAAGVWPAGVSMVGPAGVSDHGALSGLADDDHGQYQLRSEKDSASGYAGLDGSGKLATSTLPALAIGETFTAADQTAMLALPAQQGDLAIRTDLTATFVLSGADPTVLGDWTQLATPTDAVLSVNGQTGAVSLVAGDIGAATAAQGAKADTATQPADLATVATSGDHADLANKPTLGTAALLDVGPGSADVAAGDAPFTVTANTQTDDYTLVLSDAGKCVEMNKATAVTLTVPTNATVPFPVGTIIEVYAMGAGAVTVAAAGGVTVRNVGDLAAQYATASLRKRATDEWDLSGALA